jgi:hypothetical protein
MIYTNVPLINFCATRKIFHTLQVPACVKPFSRSAATKAKYRESWCGTRREDIVFQNRTWVLDLCGQHVGPPVASAKYEHNMYCFLFHLTFRIPGFKFLLHGFKANDIIKRSAPAESSTATQSWHNVGPTSTSTKLTPNTKEINIRALWVMTYCSLARGFQQSGIEQAGVAVTLET